MALTQANAIGSIGYVIGTLTVGLVADSFRDQWRIGILAVLPFVLYLFFFRFLYIYLSRSLSLSKSSIYSLTLYILSHPL